MSTNISGTTGTIINILHEKALDLSTLKDVLTINELITWSWGVLAKQVNCIFHDKRTLIHEQVETLDLYESTAPNALFNPFGEALTMTALKFLYIKNKSTESSLIILGTLDTTPIPICADPTDEIIIRPGGHFLWVDPTAAGIDITENKNLRLEHGGEGDASLDYEILALGLD